MTRLRSDMSPQGAGCVQPGGSSQQHLLEVLERDGAYRWMRMSGPGVQRGDRFAVFWGGGLGDVLVLRPLLMALEQALEEPPYFFTTASHLDDIFEAFRLKVYLHRLPTEPWQALGLIRNLGVRFDWIYLGSRPRLKTGLLAQVIGAGHIWSRRHADVDGFIGEQVLADVRALGLVGPLQPYGGAAGLTRAQVAVPRDYLLFHPGAKPRWETTRWPEENWAELLRRSLAASTLDVVLVGVAAERAAMVKLVDGLDSAAARRVQVAANWSLPQLVSAVEGSRGVVCHNSGVLHLAAALGRPTLALTGSSARYWRPPYAHVTNLSSGTCELACNQYRCPVPFYRARCIRELSVDAAMQALRTHLLP